jgi:formate dehydrogenase assembly factor FdhD
MRTTCHDLGVARVPVSRVNGAGTIAMTNAISVDEPLEICVTTESDEGYFPSVVAVTMRTPGQDDELGDRFPLHRGHSRRSARWRERP